VKKDRRSSLKDRHAAEKVRQLIKLQGRKKFENVQNRIRRKLLPPLPQDRLPDRQGVGVIKLFAAVSDECSE
jgi:hypothetical protein